MRIGEANLKQSFIFAKISILNLKSKIVNLQSKILYDRNRL